MPLKVLKREIEVESEIGFQYVQVLARAESLVPGAGREAIDVLLKDAGAAVIRADVQNDRVVLDGSIACQAVYRQGEETTLRALSAKTTISQVIEIPGTQEGMLARVQPIVENVEAKYENGHMVFLISLGLKVWVLKLEPVEVIDALDGEDGLETLYRELCLVKLAAEANETMMLTDKVELPQALDARTTLMDWGSVRVESAETDLGGMRVKGRANIETLISSGVQGRPAMQLRYPIEFDRLLELPEWLTKGAHISAELREIRTQVEQDEGEDGGVLNIQAEVRFDVSADLRDCVKALTDAYSSGGMQLEVTQTAFTACADVVATHTTETVRGTVMLGEGVPSVGSVIAVRARPTVGEILSENGRSRVRGIMEADVLYMPSGSDTAASTETEMEFEFEVPQSLTETSRLALRVVSAETSAMMNDRLEMKLAMQVDCETRRQQQFEVVSAVAEAERMPRRPGYVIYWPEADDDAWRVGKRFAIPAETAAEGAPGSKIQPGQPIVIRI